MNIYGATSIARVCHELNRAYCASIGDYSQESWEQAPDWQRESAIQGVCFHLDNPDADDAASHNNWLAAKEADGWVFGTAKDPEKKTHPCMVSFDQLPATQQVKDKLFRQTVHALAPLLT